MLRNHVLHGDLSPNNFIIHDGQGYFIDFDHAEITQGTHCIRSPGTVSKAYTTWYMAEHIV
jgi:serine/threonine protein kinase